MKTKIITFILIVCGSLSYSQSKVGDKFFENYAYVKAIEFYEKAVEKGDNSLHTLTRLGDSYYNNSKSDEAVKWYGEALKQHDSISTGAMFNYIQSLRSVGKYKEADKIFSKLTTMEIEDSRLEGYIPGDDSFTQRFKPTSDNIITIKNLSINTDQSEFGAFVVDNILYYAAPGQNKKKVYKWNKQPFLDIYQVEVIDKGNFNEYNTPTEINSTEVNTNYHEATIAITNDGQTMYFTRDNLSPRLKRLKYDDEGTTHLKLYKATLNGDSWTNLEELPFNDEKFSTGHPALSPDNKILYFVSDREGGVGQTDIYKVAINDDGSYGEPENLGDTINTEGREMFPYMSKDSTLYFSSDGHLNLGLLDIFESKIENDAFTMPKNIGEPYNSGYDDFAFFVNSDTGKGYLSSNRPDGNGGDDIYEFTSAEPCTQEIAGIVRDKRTGELLIQATVRLIDENGKVLQELNTANTSEYKFTVDCNTTYVVVGSKEDYKDDIVNITTTEEPKKVNQADLNLTPLIIDNQIVINPIFFDFDKWDIRPDAQYELENIVDVMKKHPTMVIKIESHTDSRGSDAYNMILSDNRAKSTRDYIISRGIEANRIESAIGYGESQLLNRCSNGVKCNKEEHQLNRRSYFYILKE